MVLRPRLEIVSTRIRLRWQKRNDGVGHEMCTIFRSRKNNAKVYLFVWLKQSNSHKIHMQRAEINPYF